MPIRFECPHCNRKLTVADALAGKRGKCPGCQQQVSIPASGQASPTPPPVKPEAKGKPPAPPARPMPAGKSNPAAPPASPVNGPPASSPAAPPTTRNGPAAPKAITPPANPAAPPPPSAADLEAEAAAALADHKPPEPELTSLEFECEFCFEKVQMSIDMAGKRTPCPACKRIIKVPEPKKDKKDWRSAPSLPSGARPQDGPAPEGSWDTKATSRVSQESLEEAGVLPDTRPPRTWTQRITRIVVLLLVLGASAWGALKAKEWWDSGNANRAISKGLEFAASKDALNQVKPETLAAMHLAAVDYYARTGTETAAKDAQKQFLLAFGLLTSVKGANLERDLLLIDLALSQVRLGGTPDEAKSGVRLDWNSVQRDVIAALKAIQDPRARQEGLHLVGRALIEKKEATRAKALLPQVFTTQDAQQVEAQGRMALELYQAGATKEADALAEPLVVFTKKDDKDRPALLPSSIALALKKNVELPKAKESEQVAELIGRSEGAALLGKWDDAHKRVGAEPDPVLQLQAQVRVAAVASGSQKDGELKSAYDFATVGAKGKADAQWAIWQLVELGQKAGWKEDQLQAVVDAIADPALRGRAQLSLLRERMDKGSGATDDKVLEFFDQGTASHALACLALAQHESRRGGKWQKTIENWSEPYKAFGSVGAALGMQSKQQQ